MFLIGDIGNTEIKIFLFDKKFNIKKKTVIKTKLVTSKYLSIKLNYLKTYKSNIRKILFSSVVPPAFNTIKNFLKFKNNLYIQEIKSINLKKFINIKVNKRQVGSDRIANAIGVIDNKFNYIVLDFGTATTFDVVIKNKYLGGVIAPGVSLSLKNLISKASLIPPITLSKTSKVIGTNTDTAVKSGFYWGYTGLIDNLIKLISKQTKKKYKIVLTGGLSYLFKNIIKGKKIIRKDLTIEGLLKITKYL